MDKTVAWAVDRHWDGVLAERLNVKELEEILAGECSVGWEDLLAAEVAVVQDR